MVMAATLDFFASSSRWEVGFFLSHPGLGERVVEMKNEGLVKVSSYGERG